MMFFELFQPRMKKATLEGKMVLIAVKIWMKRELNQSRVWPWSSTILQRANSEHEEPRARSNRS